MYQPQLNIIVDRESAIMCSAWHTTAIIYTPDRAQVNSGFKASLFVILYWSEQTLQSYTGIHRIFRR